MAHNKANYTSKDYLRAVWARELQIITGHPSAADYIKVVQKSMLPNCPIIPFDIQAAEISFGLDVGALKGNTTQH